MPARMHFGRILLCASAAAAACSLLPLMHLDAVAGVAADRCITRLWTADVGLPDNSVRALAWTADGYLWVGTPAGLARFDGVRFTSCGRGAASRPGEGSVLSLYEDIHGTLWVGTDGGGLYARGEAGERPGGEPSGGMLNGHVGAIAGDRRGVLWIGTDFGLYGLDGGVIRVIGLDEGLADARVTTLAVDPFGNLWAGTGWGGLALFESGQAPFETGPARSGNAPAPHGGRHAVPGSGSIRLYGPEEGLADPRILSLCADRNGIVWIGTMRGLFRFAPGEAMILPVAGTERYPVTALAPGPAGNLFVGTMVEGLKVLDADGPRDLFPNGLLGDCYVRAILSEDDGTLWIGTDAKGLIQMRERTVGAVTVADGLPEGSVYALLEDDDGTLWIGTENSGLCILRNGTIETVLDRARGLAGDMVRVLSRDRFGRLLVGTMDGGIGIVDGGGISRAAVGSAPPDKWATVSGGEGLPHENITAIATDGSGAIWIGTERSLSRSEDGRIEHAAPVGAFEGITIRTIYESEDGSLYAGTRNGPWRLSGPSIGRVRAGDDSLMLDILSVYEDGSGALWLGTNGSGLVRLANGTAEDITTRDGLPGNFIYSITEDDSARLWISCDGGVFSARRDSLAAYAEGALTILAPTLYDQSDGMPSGRCNGFCLPAVRVSRSGRRYYPTKEGIAVFEPVTWEGAAHPPSVLIESMLAGGAPLRTDGDIELPHTAGGVTFDFTALHCRAPEKCRFLYKLRGYDDSFTALHPGGGRSARYPALPPGEYEFTVYAVGNDGLWSELPASVGFVIRPPFHRTWTFALVLFAGVACAGGAAAALARHRRQRRLRSKYSTSTISDERMEKAVTGLKSLMEEERIYLDPDLTLQKMARRLNVHSNHLSRIINEKHGMSFNNYINRYRIDEARKRLADPALREKSILEIMYAVGFYSKSTFNAAFKKYVGTSPSDFRRKNS